MNDRDLETNPVTSVRDVLPLASGLLVGAALLAGAAWWLGRPSEPESRSATAARVIPAAATPPAPADGSAPEPDAEPATSAKMEEGSVAAAARPRLDLVDDRPDADHLEAAQVALEAGEVEEAVTALRRHLHHVEPSYDVLLRLGRLSREVGRLDLSAAALETALELVPDDVEGMIQLARTRLEAGEPAEARAAAQRAVRAAPEEAITWSLLGRAEMAESRWEAADVAFERALHLDPANPHLHNFQGLLYVYMRRGREAADALQTSVDLFGDDVPHYVLNNLGLAFELEGELDAARAAFEEALGISPFYVKARLNLRRVDAQISARLDSAAALVADGSGMAVLGRGPVGARDLEDDARPEDESEPATSGSSRVGEAMGSDPASRPETFEAEAGAGALVDPLLGED